MIDPLRLEYIIDCEPAHAFATWTERFGAWSDATDVDITFADDGNGTTRLLIVHSGWERLGADAQQWRDANTNGWNGLMPHFIAAATQGGM